MQSQGPTGAVPKPAAAPETEQSGNAGPTPKPRVIGTGFGAIGIAAVAAAIRYQGAASDGPRLAAPSERT